jgi:tRNA A-37 threonylcarbamoyl transferase component Bud32/DNA-binding response OmpR family regulator
MRLLYIEEDPKSRARIRHHLSCRWPDIELSAWAPLQRGSVPPEFLAQGYDAVLLAQSWPGGDGLEWLRELTTRPGFAPVIFLADRDEPQVREAATAWSAFAVLAKERIAHEALLDAVERAGQQHRRQLADWRVSPEAEESRRFGDARIPGYRRARLLARGSVSQLYIAESEKAGTLVVLKVTPSQRNASGVDQVFDRFLQEYEITTKVRHPNVVRLYELGVADDHAYLAMEYFPLGDLRRRMRGGLAPAEALGIAAQIARVLVAIHAAGVLHRDLKPGNVMMRTENQVALIDFGLAKHLALDLELTDTGLIFGTPHYMSPEQGHGQALDARSDLYSLGIVLYEMFTGAKPYTAENPMAVLYMHRNAPLPLLPEPFTSLQPLLDTLLAKEPDGRVADAATAARHIEAARSEWLARAALV